MNRYLSAAFGIGILFLSACGGAYINGSGNKTTITPSVSSFNAVHVDASLTVIVNVQDGAQPGVQLSGYETLLNHLRTYVQDNVLYVDFDNHNYTPLITNNNMVAQITVPAITALSLNGANNAEIHGRVTGSGFKMDISGTGDIKIDNIATDTFGIVLAGAANVHVYGGSVKYATYEIDGAGNMNALPLTANEAAATINGAGSIKVNAQQQLAASINGTGSIKYSGNPQVSKEVNGAGSISKAD